MQVAMAMSDHTAGTVASQPRAVAVASTCWTAASIDCLRGING